MADYSLTKDQSATKLTVSKNATVKVSVTKNPGYPKAYLSKHPGGLLVGLIGGADTTSGPSNAIIDPTGGLAITDPTGGAYITES